MKVCSLKKKTHKCKFLRRECELQQSLSSHCVKALPVCLPACRTNPTHLKHSIGGRTGNECLTVQLLQNIAHSVTPSNERVNRQCFEKKIKVTRQEMCLDVCSVMVPANDLYLPKWHNSKAI